MVNKPYIFVSYAHKDSAAVLPGINAMKNSNINVWYDEGIQAGSEWPEYIAEKVVSCSKFVLFISRAYLESQNCKRELNFAIARKKDILSVFIEDVTLSPGVEMQLGTYQSVFRNRFENDVVFHKSLCDEKWFDDCRFPEEPQPTTNHNSQSAHNTPNPNNSHSANGTNTYKSNAYTAPINEQPKQNYSSRPQPQQPTSNPSPVAVKSRITAGLLAIFLGMVGAHKFYLKKPVQGILYIVFGCFYFSAILGIIEGLILLCSTDKQFEQKHNFKAPPIPGADDSYYAHEADDSLRKRRNTAGLLAFFLGSLGIHKFYLKQPIIGILYILFCWTYVPGIIGMIEGLIILCSSNKKFLEKHLLKG